MSVTLRTALSLGNVLVLAPLGYVAVLCGAATGVGLWAVERWTR